MQASFEYMHVVSAMDSFTVEDIGNTCIAANNDLAEEYFLHIYTDCGKSYITQFGPIYMIDEDKTFPTKHGFNFDFTTIEYNEKKLSTIIDKFLNNPKAIITQVREAEVDEAYSKLNAMYTTLIKLNNRG